MSLRPNALQVVIGLGKTGLSCVQFLAAQGVDVAVTDTRENPPGLAELQVQFPHIPVSLGKIDAEFCRKATRLIVSPGVSLKEPPIAEAISIGIPTIGDIALFAETAKAPIAAVTGSNGKSSVTTLLAEMARHAGLNARTGGNLSPPALTLLSSSEPDLYILELSSFQLETTPNIPLKAAVLLNLSEDHMDRYANLAEYLAAKQHIYDDCTIKIVNKDELGVWENYLPKDAKFICFGLGEPQAGEFGLRETDGQCFLAKGDALLIDAKSLKMKGRHQLSNALAALAMGEAMDFPISAMLEALKNFSGLPHRCQWVASHNEVDWYNDSKGTNVGAAEAALTGLGPDTKGKLVVIAGGQGKNADFTPLRSAMKKYVRSLILIGQDARLMEKALQGTTHIQNASDMEEAIWVAHQQAKAGDAVILAPACASLDMFRNFEHRGEVFIELVKKLHSK